MPHVIGHTGTHNIFGDENYQKAMDSLMKQQREYLDTQLTVYVPEAVTVIDNEVIKTFKSSKKVWRKGKLKKH